MRRPRMSAKHAARRRIAIVGGGFGGVAAARALRRVNVDVTVVDRTNHQLFQPLLYQAATGALSAGECATPIRALLRGERNVRVAMGEAVGLDPERRELTLDRGERLGSDSLLVASGGGAAYLRPHEWGDAGRGL